MSRRAFLFALTLPLFLSGCGFQLRGAAPLPFKSVFVAAQAANFQRNATADRLRKLLAIAGVKVTNAPSEAEVILKLGAEKRIQTILALNSAGQVSEYRLELTLTYQVTTPGGKERLPETQIKFIRDMTYDDSQYSAKSTEADFLYQAMDEDAAQQILRHLHRIASS
jgi:LPS-assembly lipoprotein